MLIKYLINWYSVSIDYQVHQLNSVKSVMIEQALKLEMYRHVEITL